MADEAIRSLFVKLAIDNAALIRGLAQSDQGVDKLKGKLGGLGNEMGLLGSVGKNLGSTLVSLAGGVGFGALAIGIKRTVSTAVEFEAKMSKVKALAGGTQRDFERLRDAAISLGSATVFSASEAADGMATLAAAGMSTNEVLSAMPALLAGAAAAGGDFNATANTLVGTLGGFGLAASDSAHVMDVLAQAANDSRMNITDMGDVFRFTASSAKAYGVSLEEVAAAAVLMNNMGLEAGQTGRYLNQVFQQLAKPTDEAAAAMQKLGLDFFDAQGKFIGLAPLVDQLKMKLGALTVEQRSNALATIFGTEASNAMLKLMDATAPVLEKTAQGYHHVDGAAQKMADTMTDNVKGALEQLSGAFESLFIKLNSTMLPGMNKTISSTAGLVDAIGHLTQEALPLLEAGVGKISGLFGIDLVKRIDAVTNSLNLLASAAGALNALRNRDAGKLFENILDFAASLSKVRDDNKGNDPLGLLGHRAIGGPINGPGLFIGGETGREIVVPTNASHRSDGMKWWMQAGHELGIPGFATGGAVGASGGSPASGGYDPMINWAAVRDYYSQIAQHLLAEERARASLEIEVKAAVGGIRDLFDVTKVLKDSMKESAGSAAFFADVMTKGAAPTAESVQAIIEALGRPAQGLGTGTRSMNKDEGKEWSVADLVDLRGSYADPVAGRYASGELAQGMLEDWKAGQFDRRKSHADDFDAGYQDYDPSDPYGNSPEVLRRKLLNRYGPDALSPSAGLDELSQFQGFNGGLDVAVQFKDLREAVEALRPSFWLSKEAFEGLAPHVKNIGAVFDQVSKGIGMTIGMGGGTIGGIMALQQHNEAVLKNAAIMENLATGSSFFDQELARLTGQMAASSQQRGALDQVFAQAEAQRNAAIMANMQATEAQTAAIGASVAANLVSAGIGGSTGGLTQFTGGGLSFGHSGGAINDWNALGRMAAGGDSLNHWSPTGMLLGSGGPGYTSAGVGMSGGVVTLELTQDGVPLARATGVGLSALTRGSPVRINRKRG